MNELGDSLLLFGAFRCGIRSKEKGETKLAKRNHKKDMTEKTLEACGDVYADLMNVLIFGGRRVVSEGDLEQATTRSIYKASGELREQERDVAKFWNGVNCHIAFIGTENETDQTDDMPFRVIGYDGAAYRDQIRYVTDENGKRHKQRTRKYPVVTLVLYFGYKRHWRKAKSIHEALGEMPEELRRIVSDYKISVYEIAWLTEEQVACFQSDFRIVADYFVQMRKTGDYVPLPQEMMHAREVLQLMSALTEDARFELACNENKDGKEPRTMCEVLDRVENRGIQKGMQEGMQKGLMEGKVLSLKNLMETLQLTLEQAMNALKIPQEERETLKKMMVG